ncbi:hypothetical protein Pelo_18695 [Pelomyxa schiedti]|nr:hypothetical protein Pelo_18695 [Pelomyxa schiedti]
MSPQAPHVAIHTINAFGLTFNEFRDYVHRTLIHSTIASLPKNISTMSSQQRTTPPSKRDDDHGGTIDRLLVVSRVVWDHVVSPGWLDGPRDSRGHTKPDALERRHADLFRAAEAMFPIVGLVCRRVLALALLL